MAERTLDDKLDKIRSPNLQSQQKTAAVLQAIDATLKEQNTPATATAYFAALLALLSQTASTDQSSRDTTVAIVYLLDVVTPYAPHALVRAKLAQIITLLDPVLRLSDAEAPLLRPAIGCLEALLVVQDASSWSLPASQVSPRLAVQRLLLLSLDHRPKVRKRAQDALRKILRSPPPSPSIDHPAADMCANTAMAALEKIYSEANRGKKHKAAGAASGNDPNLIHALQLIRTVASASGGWPAKNIESLCELLLVITRSGTEHMTMVVFEVFEMIFDGMADDVASARLPRLLEIISELRPAPNDTQLLPPWVAILSRGYEVAAQIEPDETFLKLPELFELVAGFLESSSHNIRVSAAECLASFISNLVPRQVILDPSVFDEKILEKVARVAESLLTARFQGAWMESFSVLGAMLDSLRWRAHPSLVGITRQIGEIRGNDSFAGKAEADEVLGKAVRAMGPEAVLAVLPLNLPRPPKGERGRAWLLPILRDYISNTNLGHFRTSLVPVAEGVTQLIVEHGDAERTMEIKAYEAVVEQIWSMLPGYCDLPLDLSEAFDQSFAELLANQLYTAPSLRLDICRALRVLVESDAAVASIEEDDDLIAQSRITKATAKGNLEHLGTFAKNMLAVLFNVYMETLPQSRGPILQTIDAYMTITGPADLIETFAIAKTEISTALEAHDADREKEAKNNSNALPSAAHTLMDLVITMAKYLPRESYTGLFEVASAAVMKESDSSLQKKAYKLIPRLLESDTGRVALRERHDELQQFLLSSAEKVNPSSRRQRLAAIAALVPLTPDSSLHFIPAVLPEVIIACKDNNEKARATAFDLLVAMGRRLESAKGLPVRTGHLQGAASSDATVPASIEEYVTMVSAGLGVRTPHMISATVTAISRIVFEFQKSVSQQTLSELVQTMDLFLTDKNREIVKSVLGFVKMSVVSLPVDLMRPRIQTLLPNLMVWSHEHKGHFKAKVKHIIERMIRRFGFETVDRYCPEDDRKLIVNIRKTKERAKRRKAEANQQGEDGDEEDVQHKPARKFDNEYDEALYSSDDSDASEDAESKAAMPKGKRKDGGGKGGNTYILEGDDEPLDLLDRDVLAKVSSTKPVKFRRKQQTKAKVDLDGRLVIGGDGDDKDGGAMDVDALGEQPADGDTGVGAYVAALKGKDAPRKGFKGKLKFSNKRGQDMDMEEDGDDPVVDGAEFAAAKAKAQRSPKAFKAGDSPRFRGKPGRGGGNSGRGNLGGQRRALGEDKRRGPPMVMAGRVGKNRGGRR